MARLSFIAPAALALLLLLPVLWAFAFVTPRRVARWRFWSSLIARSVILASLVLALAGAQLIRPVRTLTTIFLLDASDSISSAQRARAAGYVEEALQTIRPGDSAGVIVFGANALVERAPMSLAALGRLSSIPIATRTNIQEAIQLGLALLPADTQKRLVLLSDGGENSGRAIEAARLAAFRGIPLDVVPLPSGVGPDVILSALDAPSTAREGQEIALGVTIRSTFATSGRLQIFLDGQLFHEQDQRIAAGTATIPLRVPAGESGFRRIEVRLEAEGDATAQNNRAAAFTDVQGPPRFLLIASTPARAANLLGAMRAAGVEVDLLTPDQAPSDLARLGEYAAVVLVDTPSRALPRSLIEALPVYVRDLGRGLAMTGGVDAFGAGGYRRTPIEDILPVNLDPLDTSMQPDLGLVMVIDRSGSMTDDGGSGGRSKLDLAKESVYQASLGLSQRDKIGLVVFDENAEWVLPFQDLPSVADIEQALSQFGPGGGTNIRPGMEQAAQTLSRADTKIKHVILLTDGIADSNYSDLVSQMREQSITISTVAIGSDANPNLEQIAEQGGGRFYSVRRAADVPGIFLQETVVVAGRDIVEAEFTPEIALQTQLIRNLGGLPALRGYNGTEVKETARTMLVTPDGKPVLAQEQIGLGRTIAWTSDLEGRWSGAWVGWDQFPRFVGGMVDMLQPPRVVEGLTLEASASGESAAFELTAENAQGQPLNELTIQGRLVAPDEQGSQLTFAQVGPGRYRATATTAASGVYLAQVAALDQQGQPLGSVSAGLVVTYSPEYSDRRENPQLLRDLSRVTGGRVDPPAAMVFEPLPQAVGSVSEIGLPLLLAALLLWPLDIALRRLFVPLSSIAPALASRRRARPEASAEDQSIARLGAAKQRAARARAENQPAVVVEPANPVAVAPNPAPSPPQSVPAAQPAPTALNDDQFARLLAAKRRARGKRDEA